MKKIFLNVTLFLGSAVLYNLNNNYLKKISHGFLQVFFIGYFNDIICPFVLFSLINIYIHVLKCIYHKPFPLHEGIYSLKRISCTIMTAGIYWEIIYPQTHPDSTGDMFDMAAYFIGALIYYYIHKLFDIRKA